MTPLRLAFAFLLPTMALCATPSRAQTQVQFILQTGSDDLRDDSIADYQVELDDGRIVNGYVYGRRPDRTTYTAPPLDLPTGLTRANIRFVRVMFSGGAPGPFPRPLDADKLWQGDQWEVRITAAAGVRPPGGGTTSFTDILADSGWF